MNIACIGTGTVGRSWAVVFALAGHKVSLWDQSEQALSDSLVLISAILMDMEKAGAISDAKQAFELITPSPSLEYAVTTADYVQESISENLEIKISLYKRLDSLISPSALIGSSTSAISGSLFMMGLESTSRCLVAHPVNPPHLIPLVELCPCPGTSPETLERAQDIMKNAGQKPVILQREIDGFLLNRLQWALMGEAMHLIGEGYCTVDDINTVMTDGLALRWSFIGPMSVAHLNATEGLEGYYTVLQEAIHRVQSSLKTDYSPSSETLSAAHQKLTEKLPLTEQANNQLRRDRNIMKLKKFLTDELEPLETS